MRLTELCGEAVAWMKLSELRPGMEHVDLEVKINRLEAPREVKTSYGAEHILIEGEVEDETGRMAVTVWNETIQQLEGLDIGDAVELRDCFISSYKGTMHVNVGRDSTITRIE